MVNYLVVMVLSSAIGFLKVIALAKLLGPAPFGHYIALYGVAVFTATLISLGLVEETIKQFPRLWTQNHQDEIAAKFRSIFKTLSLRYLVLTVFILLVTHMPVWNLEYGSAELLCVLAISWGTTIVLLYASIIRASDSIRHQKRFYFVRSVFAFIPAISLAFFFGWQGALIGEALGVLIFVYFSAHLCNRINVNLFARKQSDPTLTTAKNSGGGGKLYLAFILSAAGAQLDKMFINQFVGAAQAGTYGVVSIIYQISALLVNIITQRVGTRFIKLNFNNAAFSQQLMNLLIWVGGFAIFMALGVAGLLLIQYLDFVNAFILKYGITREMLIYAGLIAILQIYTMLDFFLIAHDAENHVLLSSALGFLVFLGSFSYGYMAGVSIEWYLIFVLLSKLVQAGVQTIFITRIITGKNSE